jgi:hypothetical protein
MAPPAIALTKLTAVLEYLRHKYHRLMDFYKRECTPSPSADPLFALADATVVFGKV